MSAREDRAVAAQGAGPLTPRQIRTLAVLARRAYGVQRRLGLADEPFDAWRHAAVADAAPGRAGLTRLTQRDFAAARDYLLQLAGARASSEAEALRAADELRRARWALARACRDCAAAFDGGAEGARKYAEAIVRARCGEESPTAREVWQAAFTLRARARKRAPCASGAPDGGKSRPDGAARFPAVFPRRNRHPAGS